MAKLSILGVVLAGTLLIEQADSKKLAIDKNAISTNFFGLLFAFMR